MGGQAELGEQDGARPARVFNTQGAPVFLSKPIVYSIIPNIRLVLTLDFTPPPVSLRSLPHPRRQCIFQLRDVLQPPTRKEVRLACRPKHYRIQVRNCI